MNSQTRIPLDPNHHPVIAAEDSSGSGNIYPAEIDTASGGVLVKSVGSSSGSPTYTIETTGLVPKVYDALTYTPTSATVDTYKYYVGGTAGTLVATLTVTYTTSTHNTLVSAVRT